MKYWEIIADNLSNGRLELGLRVRLRFSRANIWIADAHRGDGKRFVVRADEKLTAFLELEIGDSAVSAKNRGKLRLNEFLFSDKIVLTPSGRVANIRAALSCLGVSPRSPT